MNIYPLLRFWLFLLPPETAHKLTIWGLKKVPFFASSKFWRSKKKVSINRSLKVKKCRLTFPNPVGIAAGLDKDAMFFNELGNLVFGFVEIGTVTPRPQPGNPRPRLFRLKKDYALINRMGFNNDGVEVIARRLKKRNTHALIGGNIGKNKDTPNKKAKEDYLGCFEKLYPFVDYFTINVSSPNTPGLRELQDKEQLTQILQTLRKASSTKDTQKPVFLKIAPDLQERGLEDIVAIAEEDLIDGVIATNTTVERSHLLTSQANLKKTGRGGLSGKPLKKKAVEIVKLLSEQLGNDFLIIASGGIQSGEDAKEFLEAGASLVQVYTGLIYKGPALLYDILEKLEMQQSGTEK